MNINKITSVVLIMITLMIISSCGQRYCSVEGCPRETSRYSNYCHIHKCMNSNCNNRSTSEPGYCLECIERAYN